MGLARSLRARGAERGAAAVEFALLLPVMLLVIAGIVDLGRALFTQIELTNAAREGARAAIVSTVSADAVEARAAAAAPGVPGFSSNATICPSSGEGNARVEAQAAFQWLLLGPALNIVGAGESLPTNLSATAVMKCGG